MSAPSVRRFAPAKVNLALHVTGKRADGYHELDSLVAFAGVGDWLEIEPADTVSLTVTGPRAAGVPDDQNNLVWQAAEWLGPGRGAALTLEKHLPHAGGIGGGSADAASALRGLAEVWGVDVPGGAQTLGADVPVCLHGSPVRMRGIGDVLDDVPPLPKMWIVLVNAGVEVPTGSVFRAMERVDNPPMATPEWQDFESFLMWLNDTRNDMEAAARAQASVIGVALELLRAVRGCRFVRMSGSGGTCFGLFETENDARDATFVLPKDWWVAYGPVLDPAPKTV